MPSKNRLFGFPTTFQLTDEARDAPKEELIEELERIGIGKDRFIAAEPGQVFDYP